MAAPGLAHWANLARSTWYVERVQDSGGDDNLIRVGLYQRKANFGRMSKPLGFQMEFSEQETYVSRFNLGDVSLSSRLSIPQRMQLALRHGAKTVHEIADEIDAEVETVEWNVRREKGRFIVDGLALFVELPHRSARTLFYGFGVVGDTPASDRKVRT